MRPSTRRVLLPGGEGGEGLGGRVGVGLGKGVENGGPFVSARAVEMVVSLGPGGAGAASGGLAIALAAFSETTLPGAMPSSMTRKDDANLLASSRDGTWRPAQPQMTRYSTVSPRSEEHTSELQSLRHLV